jgi:hypothetical protein
MTNYRPSAVELGRIVVTGNEEAVRLKKILK